MFDTTAFHDFTRWGQPKWYLGGVRYEVLDPATGKIEKMTSFWRRKDLIGKKWRWDQKDLKRLSEIMNILQVGDFVKMRGTSGRYRWRKVLEITGDVVLGRCASGPKETSLTAYAAENPMANVMCIVRDGKLLFGKM